MINRLIEAYRSDPALDYVASGSVGGVEKEPPALFSSSLFPDIAGLEGDVGARMIMASSNYNGRVIREDAGFRFCDADTLEDVEVLTRIANTWAL
jgi:CTP:molybdopterin cytidylyltransferase MocA